MKLLKPLFAIGALCALALGAHAAAPPLWYASYWNKYYTSSQAGCLDYGQTLFANLGLTNIERLTNNVVGVRGSSTVVIACSSSSTQTQATLMVTNFDSDEARCVRDSISTMMSNSTTGAGATINCPLDLASNCRATYASDGSLRIPCVDIPGAFSTTTYDATLRYVPNSSPMTFSLTGAQQKK